LLTNTYMHLYKRY